MEEEPEISVEWLSLREGKSLQLPDFHPFLPKSGTPSGHAWLLAISMDARLAAADDSRIYIGEVDQLLEGDSPKLQTTDLPGVSHLAWMKDKLIATQGKVVRLFNWTG